MKIYKISKKKLKEIQRIENEILDLEIQKLKEPKINKPENKNIYFYQSKILIKKSQNKLI